LKKDINRGFGLCTALGGPVGGIASATKKAFR